MRLQYTEHRPSVNRNTVEQSLPFYDTEGFTAEILRQIHACLTNSDTETAHRLIDWYDDNMIQGGPKPDGPMLVHSYGTRLDPVGTWEIIK